MKQYGPTDYYRDDLHKLEGLLVKDKDKITFSDALFVAYFIGGTRVPDDMVEAGVLLVIDYLNGYGGPQSKRLVTAMLPTLDSMKLSEGARSRLLVAIAMT